MAAVEKSGEKPRPTRSRTILWSAIGIGLLFWGGDACMDAYLFQEGTLVQQLVAPPAVEIWMRTAVMGLLLGFGLYSQSLLTQRDQALQELKSSEAQYQDLYEHAPDMFASVDARTGRILRCNQTLANATGYSKDEMVGRHISEMYHPDCVGGVLNAFREFVGTGEVRDAQLQLRRKDGGTIDVSINISAVRDEQGKILFSRSVWRDVTRRRRAEQALRDSERRVRQQLAELDLIYDSTPVGLCLMDSDLRFARINERLAAINGLPPAEHLGRTLQEIAPDIAAKVEPIYREVIETQKAALEFEVEGVTPAEPTKERTWQVSYHPLVDQDRVWGVTTVVQDITERKRTEQALRLTQFAIERAADCMYWMGPDAKFTYVNEAACNALGFTREELLSMSVHDIDPDYAPESWPRFWNELRERGSFIIEAHHRTKEGRLFPVEIRVNHLQYQGREFNCSIVRDISERKRVEAELREREQQLLQTLEDRQAISRDLHDGTLQSLYGVGLGLEACKTFLPKDPKGAVRQIDDSIRQLNALIAEARDFITGLDLDTVVSADFGTSLEQLTSRLSRTSPIQVQLEIDPSVAARLTRKQAVQLLYMVNECLSNTIRHAQARRASVKLKREDNLVLLEVQDDGVGFDVEGRGQGGHGLGNLAARAQQVGGRIDVSSKPGQSTRIQVALPLPT